MASGLSLVYGCQIPSLIGALLSGLGLAIGSAAEDYGTLLFSIGILAGGGFGLQYIPSRIITTYYFDKKRSTAVGIATAGTGLGTLTLGRILMQYGEDSDWRTTMLISSMIAYSCLFFSFFYKPWPGIDPPAPPPEEVDDTALQRFKKAILQSFNCQMLKEDRLFLYFTLSLTMLNIVFWIPVTYLIDFAKVWILTLRTCRLPKVHQVNCLDIDRKNWTEARVITRTCIYTGAWPT